MSLELALIVFTLCISLLTQPWRQLRGGALVSPLLAIVVILPFLWALPRWQMMPLPLQLTGACAVTLMMGWPLAVWVLGAVGLIAQWIAPANDWDSVFSQIVWLGLLPSTLALGLGFVLRRWVWHNPFVYILGRGFLGTVLCTFIAQLVADGMGQPANIPAHPDGYLSTIGVWLMAWGDGFMTGMLTAIFVAYRPEWLATWSDRIYLKA
jgi:uncharacterized membrane protein